MHCSLTTANCSSYNINSKCISCENGYFLYTDNKCYNSATYCINPVSLVGTNT